MDDERPGTAELLTAWRDATRAAELADRLALMAAEAMETADRSALGSEEIAKMAERAAKAADRAARSARQAAQRAAEFAAETRLTRLHDADQVVVEAREVEVRAREAYTESEAVG